MLDFTKLPKKYHKRVRDQIAAANTPPKWAVAISSHEGSYSLHYTHVSYQFSVTYGITNNCFTWEDWIEEEVPDCASLKEGFEKVRERIAKYVAGTTRFNLFNAVNDEDGAEQNLLNIYGDNWRVDAWKD